MCQHSANHLHLNQILQRHLYFAANQGLFKDSFRHSCACMPDEMPGALPYSNWDGRRCLPHLNLVSRNNLEDIIITRHENFVLWSFVSGIRGTCMKYSAVLKLLCCSTSITVNRNAEEHFPRVDLSLTGYTQESNVWLYYTCDIRFHWGD